MMTIEVLVPEDHFLWKRETALDLSFDYEEAVHLYSRKYRRPPITPVVMVKYLLLDFLHSIPPEWQIDVRCAGRNAFRWYLGINLDERMPDHSTIFQLRRLSFRQFIPFHTSIFALINNLCNFIFQTRHNWAPFLILCLLWMLFSLLRQQAEIEVRKGRKLWQVCSLFFLPPDVWWTRTGREATIVLLVWMLFLRQQIMTFAKMPIIKEKKTVSW